MNSVQKKVYTLPEAATFLRVNERTVRRFIKRGLLHKSNATRKIILDGQEVENFLERTK